MNNPIEAIFSKALEGAKNQVKTSNDSLLNNGQLKNLTFANHQIDVVNIMQSKISIILGSEIITTQNAPQGLSFYYGQEMNFVAYKIPYKSEYEFIDNIINGSRITHGIIYREGDSIIVKIYSQFEIINNSEELNRLKLVAKNTIDSIQKKQSEINLKIEEFNTSLLKTISEEINNEKQRRIDINNAKNILNPFS